MTKILKPNVNRLQSTTTLIVGEQVVHVETKSSTKESNEIINLYASLHISVIYYV